MKADAETVKRVAESPKKNKAGNTILTKSGKRKNCQSAKSFVFRRESLNLKYFKFLAWFRPGFQNWDLEQYFEEVCRIF